MISGADPSELSDVTVADDSCSLLLVFKASVVGDSSLKVTEAIAGTLCGVSVEALSSDFDESEVLEELMIAEVCCSSLPAVVDSSISVTVSSDPACVVKCDESDADWNVVSVDQVTED
ncbi:unnamed protein product [Gongylonema pulchrum]|uniref:Uncharacterized protein n=1 Tax=Gongylonema pulchrum TaxID=637853 RepID=A0A183EPP8_9BILA|nr:unnamed protein product [Gongylonema pulchrum]